MTYAASACDEYFESLRAWIGANDPHSLWPRVSEGRLATVDPRMFRIASDLMAQVESHFPVSPILASAYGNCLPSIECEDRSTHDFGALVAHDAFGDDQRES